MNRDIDVRAMDYAVRAVKLFRYLIRAKGSDDVNRIIGRQFLRSATSIGANLAEGQAGQSRPDFIHKHTIAQKEARESSYWLRLMQRINLVPAKRLQPLIQKTEEIAAIITAIIVKTKKKRVEQP